MNTQNVRTALITGASSGIGAAFARKLASQGYDLVLVARREARLRQLAAELQQQFHTHADILVADLSQLPDVEQVERRIGELASLELLVNNAGFGIPGKFAEVPLERTVAMINVHILASTRLSRAVLPGMITQGSGGIINVSSIGGFMPSPAIEVIYCATKAYLIVFSQGLQAQLNLQGTGVRVQALCPGFTDTEFHDDPGYEALRVKSIIPTWLWMSAGEVVEASLQSLESGQVICIPGFKNRAMVALARSKFTSLLPSIWRNLLGSSRLSNKAVSRTSFRG